MTNDYGDRKKGRPTAAHPRLKRETWGTPYLPLFVIPRFSRPVGASGFARDDKGTAAGDQRSHVPSALKQGFFNTLNPIGEPQHQIP